MGVFQTFFKNGVKIARQQTYFRTATAAKSNIDIGEDSSEEWQKAKPFDQIPTESKFSILNNFFPGGKFHGKDLMQLMLFFKSEYGDIFAWPKMFGRNTMVYTHNPDDFAKVFRNEGIWPIRPAAEAVLYYRSKYRSDFFQGIEGLVSTSGEHWSAFRTAVNPILMKPRNIQLYLSKMSQVNQEFVDRIRLIRDPKTLEVPENFEEEINRWNLESVSIVALDKQLGLLKGGHLDPQIRTLFENLKVFFKVGTDLEVKPSIWKYFPTPSLRKFVKAMDAMREVILHYINEAVERLNKERDAGIIRPEHQQSVLEKLLKLDKRIATVMAMDLLMAGVDTTTATFTSIMLCLSKFPHQQAKVREEALRLLPNKDSEFPPNALEEMPFLRAFMKESMRLFPLVTINVRVPQKNVVLSGYRVPAGTSVLMVSTSLLHDNRYFPEGLAFRPERWMRTNNNPDLNLKPTNPFIYLPFGYGPRSCIGKRIVEMELMLGVARIVRNFHVEFNYPTDNVFKGLMINMPNVPLKFKFTDLD